MLDEVLDLFGWAPPPRAQPKSSPAPKPPSAAPVPPAPRPAPAPAAASGRPSAAPAPSVEPKPKPRQKREPARKPEPRITPGAAAVPQGRSVAETLAVVARVAPQFASLVFTRNRRVMASVADRGRALRLNVAFSAAPDDVLVAVGRLFTARDTRTRNRARDAVRRFIAAIPGEGAPARTRTRSVAPADAAHIARLQAEFDRVNDAYFGGELPRVPLYLSGQMRRRNGHFSSSPLEIVISRRLCTHAAPAESEATMRHEMIHLWQHAQGGKPDHGGEFRAWARKLDVHPRATRPVKWLKGGE
nr:SprT-like domain-containing protein [Longimicrobium terrae]